MSFEFFYLARARARALPQNWGAALRPLPEKRRTKRVPWRVLREKICVQILRFLNKINYGDLSHQRTWNFELKTHLSLRRN